MQTMTINERFKGPPGAQIPLDDVIDSISESFSELPAFSKKSDRNKLKTALKSRINMLEELYDQI